MELKDLKLQLKTLQEAKQKFKELIDDVDLDLMFTDIKDKQGEKFELSDEFMELIGL